MGPATDGARPVKEFYGRTKDEALEKARAYAAAHPSGPPSVAASQTLNELLATWVELIVKEHDQVSTYEMYLGVIKRHIAPTIGRTRLCDLTRPLIQAWLNELAKKPTDGTGKAKGRRLGRTVGIAHSIVRAALNYAIDCEIIDRNMAERVRLPEYQKRKAKALDPAQARAVLAAARGELDLRKPIARKNGRPMTPIPVSTRYAPLYLLYLAAGPRRGEPLAARWSDLDLDAGTWDISRSLDGRRRVRGTKTDDSARVVELDPALIDALRAHRTAMQAEAHWEGWKPDGLVFPSASGTTISPRNLARHFKTVLAAAGLPTSFTLHDLRHSAGSLMLAAGASLTDVSKVLGHSSPATTGRVYAHAYREGKRRAVAGALGQLQPPDAGAGPERKSG